MGFYDLSKAEREQKYLDVQNDIYENLVSETTNDIDKYFSDSDTYIRKAGYLAIGKLYKNNDFIRCKIIKVLEQLMQDEDEKVRQTVINSCGEIAIMDFESVARIFEIGLLDNHHSVKNAVQGSLKKSGEKNHMPIISFCQKHIQNDNPEVRRQIAHGLELRGRTHPEDIMLVLKLLQFDNHKRVRPMVVHIFGQISYKKDCLPKVVKELLTWDDEKLVNDCLNEIIKQHEHINNHFKTVETLSPEECRRYINEAKIKSVM